MKILKGIFYFFFGFFILLLVATYFIERFFLPTRQEILTKISKDSKYPLKFESINYNGNKIGYAAIGNDTAQRVILVHGSPGNWGNYYKVLDNDALYNNHYLISLDRWGYGMTDGEHGEGDLTKHANYIRELCKPSRGGRKPIVVGHSMGGPIAIACGISYSNDLTGIISVAGSFDSKLEPNEWFRGLYKVFPMNLFFSRDLKASNDELFVHRNALDDMKPHWNEITCKVTIIQGGKDNLVAPGNLAFAKQQLGNKEVTYTFIPDEDHFIPFGDHPEPIFNAINEMSK
jgi:pimeloyl-ACP methyl ester carboxylesterase